jgi:glycosyltransferase involved in cell wall biosynthesis
VLRNLRPGDEYFVIDGGSSDTSVEILRRHEGDLSGWLSEPDNGYAEALAKGFARTTGTFMCWINSGDVLLNGALDRAREMFEQSGADFIFGDDLYIDESGTVISYSSGYVKSLHDTMLYGGWTPLQDACFWRRSAYEHIGGINPKMRYAADYDLFLRFSANCICRYVPIVFSAFRRHSGQKSIGRAEEYLKEREASRQNALASIGELALRQKLKSVYYWMFVRFRARVLRWYRDRPALRGRAVSTLSATA